jgi:hypothetical protein
MQEVAKRVEHRAHCRVQALQALKVATGALLKFAVYSANLQR